MTTYIGNPPKSVYGVKDATNLLYREVTTVAAAEHTLSGIFQDYNMEDTLVLEVSGVYTGSGNSVSIFLNGDTTNANYRSMENYRDSGAPTNSTSNSASSYAGWMTETGYYTHRFTITPIKVVGGTRFKIDSELKLNETTSPYEGTLVNTTITHVATQTDLTSIAYKIDGTTNIQADTTFSLYNTVATNLILPLEYSAPRQNILMNTDFAINQRGYTSGSATLIYQFTYDRWASLIANNTLSVSGIVATIDNTTASTDGSFYQKVEEDLMIEGDWYTLSWEGTALADIAGLTNQTSPVTFRAPAPSNGEAVIVIFHGDGVTLSKPKLEEGTSVTPWEKPDKATELARCQRYYQTTRLRLLGYSTIELFATATLPVKMHSAPTVTQGTATNIVNTSATSFSTISREDVLMYYIVVTSAGRAGLENDVFLSAEL